MYLNLVEGRLWVPVVVSSNPTTPTTAAPKADTEPGAALRVGLGSAISRPAMSNRAIWNVRLRHEWLRKPKKSKRLKNRDRVRLGMRAPVPVEAPKAG